MPSLTIIKSMERQCVWCWCTGQALRVGDKLVPYQQQKTSCELEAYARVPIPVAARLVASSSKLNLEGSHVPYDQWTCKICGQVLEYQTTSCWYTLHYMKHEWSYSRQYQGNSYWTQFPTSWSPSSTHRITFCNTMRIYQLYIARRNWFQIVPSFVSPNSPCLL